MKTYEWMSFWIKPEAAPARVTLGVTSLLTLSTQHAKSQSSLPPVSYVKAVDSFMSACTIFVFMALMEYCLVNIVLGDSENAPKPAEKNAADKSAAEKNADTSSQSDMEVNVIEMELQDSEPNSAKSNKAKADAEKDAAQNAAQNNRRRAINIDRFSRIFFPALFTLLNAMYWITFAKYL